MKHVQLIAMAGTLIWLVGCASTPPVALTQPVGPAPTASSTGMKDGSLLVYSAREPANIPLNQQIWSWNDDFGRNDFLYEPAHTDYTIYSSDGQVLEHVRNATNYEDPHPAQVTLAPGQYVVQAKAEVQGGGTIKVKVPVVVATGECTKVHLAGEWMPSGHYTKAEVVRLPTGEFAGWRAPEVSPIQTQTKTSS